MRTNQKTEMITSKIKMSVTSTASLPFFKFVAVNGYYSMHTTPLQTTADSIGFALPDYFT